MPRIPFPVGIDGSEKLARTRRELRNCFNNLNNRIIPRPGIQSLNTTGGIARGQFVWNGAIYQVVSQDLIKITNPATGAFITIGTVLGSENIDSAIGFNDAVIVVKGATGAIYSLSKTDVLTLISNNANFVPCRAVTHIDGRFVYIPFDGDPAFFSDVGDAGTVQVDSFFDAEELPDKNQTAFNFKNTLYIGGTDSFELFRNTGAIPNPFGRITGARIDNGFLGSLIEYNQTFLFIGREKDQGFGIYAIGQGNAPKVSNERIDEILNTYTEIELAEGVGGRIKWRGYDIATFALARHSFGFFGGNWFSLDENIGGFDQPWSGGFINQFEGKYYSASRGNIGVFANIKTDYGAPIMRIIDTAFEQEDDDYFGAQTLELGISQGFDSASATVALSLSRDNITYGQPVYRSTGSLGQYGQKLTWNYPGGLGRYDGFMGVRLYTTENLEFAADRLIVTLNP